MAEEDAVPEVEVLVTEEQLRSYRDELMYLVERLSSTQQKLIDETNMLRVKSKFTVASNRRVLNRLIDKVQLRKDRSIKRIKRLDGVLGNWEQEDANFFYDDVAEVLGLDRPEAGASAA